MNKNAKSVLIVTLFVGTILLLAFGLAIAQPGSRGSKECNDDIDNDNDGKIDMQDDGCDTGSDTDESNCGDEVCEGGEVCDVCIADCGECDPIPDSCADTDGGVNIAVQGTASGYLNEQSYEYPDYCVNNATLMEYYCVEAYATGMNMTCNTTAICLDGACR